MTLNVLIATRDYALCASDMRLTGLDGKTYTEVSNKVVQLSCRDAETLITYNGIGWDTRARTPAEWMCDISGLAGLGLGDAVTAIKEDTTERISRLPETYAGMRHSVVGTGFLRLANCSSRAFVFSISNYQRIDGSIMVGNPATDFVDELLVANTDAANPVSLTVAGDTSHLSKEQRRSVQSRIRCGLTDAEARKTAEKLIRSASFGAGRRGKVGSRILCGVVYPDGRIKTDLGVVGGSKGVEFPAMIGPGGSIKGLTWIPGGRFGDSVSDWRGGRLVRREAPCTGCGNPVPVGDRLCGACGHLSTRGPAAPSSPPAAGRSACERSRRAGSEMTADTCE